jgi:NAD(P)-dependent dehydrogenase (short-subunit alcohol dehydrogenase family)
MPRLAGKVAFITGAGNGIGRATAILFAREGAKVAIAEIAAQAGEETAHLAGNETIAIRTDVTDPDSLQSAIRATVDKFGRLDVLHNNAGGSTAQDDTAVNAPLDEFWRAIKLDLYGTFLGCRFGIPELIKAGGGSVINMSSNVALGRRPRLLHGGKGRDRCNYPFAGCRLRSAKSSRQCDCAVGDHDRAGQETGRGKRRADAAGRLSSARRPSVGGSQSMRPVGTNSTSRLDVCKSTAP